MTEQSDSIETHSSNEDIELSENTPRDQSGAFICGERKDGGVAEAALQDGEKQTHPHHFYKLLDVKTFSNSFLVISK